LKGRGSLQVDAELELVGTSRGICAGSVPRNILATTADIWFRVADQISWILEGDNPGDIPIYQPKQFRFVINIAAAKAIALQLS
jgi:hypothetical protein